MTIDGMHIFLAIVAAIAGCGWSWWCGYVAGLRDQPEPPAEPLYKVVERTEIPEPTL